jgi:hypothetical protein
MTQRRNLHIQRRILNYAARTPRRKGCEGSKKFVVSYDLGIGVKSCGEVLKGPSSPLKIETVCLSQPCVSSTAEFPLI